jgi:anaerobic selenocysteine-containing dehydrogenase
VEETDLVVLWGSNARETHPIFFHHLLRGVRNGARVIVVDPRRTSSAEWADLWLGLDVGSDIALANAVAREIIHASLANEGFIARATSGFEAYREAVEPCTLEWAELQTGVPAEAILMEDRGRSTQESLEAVAAILAQREAGAPVFVSDRLHMLRVMRIAKDLGVDAYGSPATNSPSDATLARRVDATVHELGALAWYGLVGRPVPEGQATTARS